MKKILSVLTLALALTSISFANEYKLDENKVDGLFNQATEISINSLSTDANAAAFSSALPGDNNMVVKLIVALIIDYVGLGFFGIHRYIIGTSGTMWLWYTITCGGIFYLVPFIDFWVLLIDGLVLSHGDKYANNQKFFMWI